MKLIVKFKPTTLGFKKRTAFSFLPSCARIKSPARRQFNTDRVGAGPRIRIRRSSLEGVQQFSRVYLHFINRKQDLSFSSSSAGTEFHGDFGSHPHPSLQAGRSGSVRSGPVHDWFRRGEDQFSIYFVHFKTVRIVSLSVLGSSYTSLIRSRSKNAWISGLSANKTILPSLYWRRQFRGVSTSPPPAL